MYVVGMSIYSMQQQREKRVTYCVFIVDVIGKTLSCRFQCGIGNWDIFNASWNYTHLSF